MSFSARCFTFVALWHVFLNRGNENVSKTFFTVSYDSETNHNHVWCKVENQLDLGTLGSKFTHLLTTSTQEPIQRCSNYNPCEPHREISKKILFGGHSKAFAYYATIFSSILERQKHEALSRIFVAFSREKINNTNNPWKITMKHYQCRNKTTQTYFQSHKHYDHVPL